MMDFVRIRRCREQVCCEIAALRNGDGYWTGHLSSSALATATAVSALSVFRNTVRLTYPNRDFIVSQKDIHGNNARPLTAEEFDGIEQGIRRGTRYLVGSQNTDGGWGDTNRSLSNLSATLLVKSALLLSDFDDSDEQASSSIGAKTSSTAWNTATQTTGHNSVVAGWSMNLLEKADVYLRQRGGIAALLQSYGRDMTFSVPILTNAALAGLVPWKEVPQLPFERSLLLGNPVFAPIVSRLIPVVSYAIPALVAIGLVRHQFLAPNPVMRLLRNIVKNRTLKLIETMQPESGGYLEAIPLTAFTVMSLAGSGLIEHPIVRNGLRFLLNTVRDDGAWAIDSNLATWLTSQAVTALRSHPRSTFDYLSASQHSSGGWGWTHLSGAVPDADDTAAALLAIQNDIQENRLKQAEAAIHWLLKLQNTDGGIPAFCRGWGLLPFDRSCTDITAHVLRAFHVWKTAVDSKLQKKMHKAEKKMLAFLIKQQQQDGAWIPLWFGCEHEKNVENPIFGTARVLIALAEIPAEQQTADNALQFLLSRQNTDGGWGTQHSTIEETAVVLEALTKHCELSKAADAGWEFLLSRIETGKHHIAAPIGLYFSQLWYYEEMYPLLFSASALAAAEDAAT